MAGREQLMQRYADLLEPEFDAELLQVVAELDEAVAPYSRIEPPATLDQAIQQMARQRRVPSLNGRSLATVDLESPVSSAGHARLPTRLRTGWVKQGLGMVAAILVLVLVAGVLATVLRGEGQSSQGGLGTGGMATTSPHLPMTVMANSVAVTLESVEVGPSTIFTFIVKLPPSLAAQSQLSVPSTRPLHLFQVAGLTVGPPDPILGIQTHTLGNPFVTFSVHYSTVPSPNQRITLTLLRLPFSATPSDPNTIEGPWTFVITPEMRTTPTPATPTEVPTNSSQDLPTPDSTGHYAAITFLQAQRLAPFTLAKPKWVPPYLVDKGITAFAIPQLDVRNGTPTLESPSNPTLDRVSLWYGLQDVTQNSLVVIQETGHPVQTGIPSNATQTTLAIAGQTVTRAAYTTTTGPMAEYQWQVGGTSFDLSVHFAGPLTEQDVEHVIASMLGESGVATTPQVQVQPTATAPSAPVSLSQESSVWSAVMQAVGTSIDPVLKPRQLPDGFAAIRLVNATAGAFGVEYDGPGQQLFVAVSIANPSLCGPGCTQSQVTVRGQQATLQVNDAYAGHITLWWNEPGTWHVLSQPPGIEYLISADGLTPEEVKQIAESLVPVNG